ncbi:PQQ-binding-like beta-propeller repeat protein [Natronosalvus caseinilyticus]|uniref:outer membrane protein assembly factor BamB family protein n=1 Tax=Natronosalvus caseinilyticus TaxID=2953747 RepID=UPI0028A5FCD1|nr:PQQ-binding-like beta-propeller repeat protein [Natronosalvus caseinilyticus]
MPRNDTSNPDDPMLGEPDDDLEVTLGIDQLQRFLSADDPDVRTYAASTLAGEAADRPREVCSAVPALIDRLEDEPSVRANATAALAAIATEHPAEVAAGVPALTDRLEGSTAVRVDAVDALAAISDAEPAALLESVEALAAVVSAEEEDQDDHEDEDAFVCRRATAALAAVADADPGAVRPVAASIAAVAHHEDEMVREHAVRALRAVAESDPTALAATTDAATPLLERLDDYGAIRADAMAALRALAVQDDPTPIAVEPVAERLDDENRSVREDAAHTLLAVAAETPARASTALDPLTAALADAPSIREPTIHALRHVATADPALSGLESSVPPVTDRLTDVQTAVRTDAAATLRAVADERPATVQSSVGALAAVLEDDVIETREHAAAAIEAVAEEHPDAVAPVVADLAARLDDEDEDGDGDGDGDEDEDEDEASVRANVARALAAVAAVDPDAVRAVVPSLTACLDEPNESVRRPTAHALGAIARDGAVDQGVVERSLAQLETGRGDEIDTWQQGHAARSLAEVAEAQVAGVHPAVRSLSTRLAADDVAVRRAASRDLAGVATERPRDVRSAVEPLAASLEDDDASVRNNAAIALRRLGEAYPEDVRSALGALFGAVDDPDRTVRTNVVAALTTIGPDGDRVRSPARALAVAETTADDASIRTGALEALGVLLPETGDETIAVVDAVLDRLADDCRPAERSAALEALETILTRPIETDPTPTEAVLDQFDDGSGARTTALARSLADLARVDTAIVEPLASSLLERLADAERLERQAHLRTLSAVADGSDRAVVALLLDRPGDRPMEAVAADLATLAVVEPGAVSQDADAVADLLEHETPAVRGYATLSLATVAVLENDSTLETEFDAVEDRLVDAASLVAGGETPTHTDAINNQLSGLGRRVDGDPWAAGTAVLALSVLADCSERLRPTAISKIAAGLAVDSPVVRVTTARTLAAVAEDDDGGFESSASALVDALEDEDDSVRAFAIRALSALAPRGDVNLAAARDTLVARLADPDSRVREQACHGLGFVGVEPSILEPLGADPVPAVAEAAVRAQNRATSAHEPIDDHDEWGDWSAARADAARTGAVPDGNPLSSAVDVQWRFDPDVRTTAPTVVGDTVYVGTGSGRVLAISLETGDERWGYQTDGIVTGPPAVVADEVYAASADGTMYALERETGERSWQYRLDATCRVAPAVADGTVYAADDDGSVYALEAESGRVEWTFATDETVAVAEVAVTGGGVFAGTTDGVVRRIDGKSGSLEWTRDLRAAVDVEDDGGRGGDEDANAEETSYLAATDDLVVATDGDSLYALEAADGAIRWRFDTGGALEAPAVARGTVYVASADLSVYAVDLASGVERFRFDTGGATPTAPAVVDGTCCVGTDEGVIYALDATDGAARWRYDTETGAALEGLTVASGLLCTAGPGGIAALGDDQSSWADRIGFSGLFTRFGANQ